MAETKEARKAISPWRDALRIFLRNRPAVLAMVMILALAAAAITGKLLTGRAPTTQDRIATMRTEVLGDRQRLEVNEWAVMDPLATELKDKFRNVGSDSRSVDRESLTLGSDHLGRDVLARLWAGSSISLLIGFLAVGISVTLGIAMGGVAGFFGRERVRLPLLVTILCGLAGGVLLAADFPQGALVAGIASGVSLLVQLVVALQGRRLRPVLAFVSAVALLVATHSYNRHIETGTPEGEKLASAREGEAQARATLLQMREFGLRVKELEDELGQRPIFKDPAVPTDLEKAALKAYEDLLKAKGSPDWRCQGQLELELQQKRYDLALLMDEQVTLMAGLRARNRDGGEAMVRAGQITEATPRFEDAAKRLTALLAEAEARLRDEGPALRAEVGTLNAKLVEPRRKAKEARDHFDTIRFTAEREERAKAQDEADRLEKELNEIEDEQNRKQAALTRMEADIASYRAAVESFSAKALVDEAARLTITGTEAETRCHAELSATEGAFATLREKADVMGGALDDLAKEGADSVDALRDRQLAMEYKWREVALAVAEMKLAHHKGKIAGLEAAMEKVKTLPQGESRVSSMAGELKIARDGIPGEADKTPEGGVQWFEAAVARAKLAVADAEALAKSEADARKLEDEAARSAALAASAKTLAPIKLQASNELLERRAELRKKGVEAYAAKVKNLGEGLIKAELPSGHYRYGLYRYTRNFITYVVLILLVVVSAMFVAGAAQGALGDLKSPLKPLFLPTITVDDLVMRFTEIMMTIPVIFLILAVLALFPQRDVYIVMAVIGLTSWMGTTRFVRAEILSLREQDFVQAARALGLSNFRIIWRHLVPNSISPVLVSATLGVAGAVLAESTLSFLGIGAGPDQPTWGQILSEGRLYLNDAPWLTWIPGIAILITVLAFNLLGEGLREAFNPKLRGR
ncbi:MAG: ABC transporter permease subunit [Planctomycetes bacterium]|nr:ABC transporter permease subunit [Planctomycetota bacterium]